MTSEKGLIETDFKENLEKAMEVLRENKNVFQQKGMQYEEILTDSMIRDLQNVMVLAKNLIDKIKQRETQLECFCNKEDEIQ